MRLLEVLRRARTRPLSFLLWKAGQVAATRARTLAFDCGWNVYRDRHGRRPPLARRLDLLDRSLLISPARAGEVSRLGNETGLAETDPAADLLTEDGVVSFFGSSPVCLEGIDWSRDYKSGLTWPYRFHSRVDYRDLSRPSDVKFPWELSRLQFLAVLGRRYLRSAREELARRAGRVVGDFDRANPVGVGVAWACPMDCALRAISLIWMRTFFGRSPSLDDAFWDRLLEMLIEHGRFIYRNLEWSDIRGNHYSSNLLGLLYIALSVPWHAESRRWKQLALRELGGELAHQTYEDGVTHEGSVPYHRLVLEIFLHAFLVCRAHRLPLPKGWADRLERMFEFVAGYLKPDGCAPLVGDNDDGRVQILGDRRLHDHRYLLAIGAVLFGRGDWKTQAGRFAEEALWLLGPEGWQAWQRLPAASSGGSRAFPGGGFWILRSGGAYACIHCGDVGFRGRGGHGHNDALSVCLCLGGRDIVVDRGMHSYTADRQFRLASLAAEAHNAPIVDGLEPSAFSFWDIPAVTAYPVEVLDWRTDGEGGWFRGRHDGYLARLGVRVERELQLDSMQRIVVRDRLLGDGQHQVQWRWILAPDLVIEHIDQARRAATLAAPDGAGFEVRWSSPLEAHDEADQVFPSYGCIAQTSALVLQVRSRLPLEATMEFCPRVPPGTGTTAAGEQT
ncbi:MAG: Heparin-sulfate lyase precursor [Planctomycetes bacterium ADurb.Bin126]|nr:MAG: Heparin-sulfate lyase precursor [Planctomycetes bacterium ADurb.Bin126]HOD80986.1 alginate lyase family protein [Phycisphaerae bacterium]HQL73333.1 alginate lyase family protein [Phycisphaerae bacterium]